MLYLAGCLLQGKWKYGVFFLGKKGCYDKAHRVAWMINNAEPIPEGMVIMHTCDAPSCVNPSHLRLGTPLENARGRDRKGRAYVFRGSDHPMRKLSDQQVIDIRGEYARGSVTQVELGQRYGVTNQTIHRIVRRKGWAHIPESTLESLTPARGSATVLT